MYDAKEPDAKDRVLGRVSAMSNSPGKFLVNMALSAATDSGVRRGGACSCQDGGHKLPAFGVPAGARPLV